MSDQMPVDDAEELAPWQQLVMAMALEVEPASGQLRYREVVVMAPPHRRPVRTVMDLTKDTAERGE